MTFGQARLGKFSASELRELVNATLLERVFPATFDADRFSKFQWLVVEEEVPLDARPAARAIPRLFEIVRDRDYGQIEPHKGRFPPVVEDSLFALLLAPWEEWSPDRRPDWRGFNIPWVYTVVEDIFTRPQPPFSADTLAWRVLSFDDRHGGTEELEVPEDLLSVKDAARHELAAYMEARWPEVKRALGSPLLGTPVVHFFVRAFVSEGIDEFVAHMTTIEAGLGL